MQRCARLEIVWGEMASMLQVQLLDSFLNKLLCMPSLLANLACMRTCLHIVGCMVFSQTSHLSRDKLLPTSTPPRADAAAVRIVMRTYVALYLQEVRPSETATPSITAVADRIKWTNYALI